MTKRTGELLILLDLDAVPGGMYPRPDGRGWWPGCGVSAGGWRAGSRMAALRMFDDIHFLLETKPTRELLILLALDAPGGM